MRLIQLKEEYVIVSDDKIKEGYFLHPKGVIFPVTEHYKRCSDYIFRKGISYTASCIFSSY
jgi:hypothetical protein